MRKKRFFNFRKVFPNFVKYVNYQKYALLLLYTVQCTSGKFLRNDEQNFRYISNCKFKLYFAGKKSLKV